jgi:hypothetical protein
LRQPIDRGWVEADKPQAARIEAASKRAKARDERLPAGSFLGSAISYFYCPEHVRVGTPSFYGGFAFVTATSDKGTTVSAYEHQSGKWVWVSASWDGEALIQY